MLRDFSAAKIIKTRFTFLVTSLSFTFLFNACVQQPSGSGRKATSTSNVAGSSGKSSTSAAPPTFNTSNVYFQKGASAVSGPLSLDVDFKDSVYIRGKDVHNFITKGGNVSAPQCLLSYFPGSLNKKAFVMVARPQVFYNFTTSSQEYFYQIFPADKTGNSTFCQTAGVSSRISTLYSPAVSTAFSIADVCPSCLPSVLDSQDLRLLEVNGIDIANVSVSSLKIKINTSTSTSAPVGTSCTTSQECKNLAFDCCNQGVCVKDKQIKSDVDQTSAAYLQALADIVSNPANILNYPQYYYLCSQTIVPTPTPTPSANPEIASNLRMTLLKELYDCVTPFQGEASICTTSYELANTFPVDFVTGNDDRTFSTTYTGTAGIASHSIYEINHSGVVLFSAGGASSGTTYQINGVNPGGTFLPTVATVAGTGVVGLGNDTLTDPVRIYLNKAKPTSATNDTLKIKYKIDGSCRYISSSLAECKKYYVQGQNLGQVDDHYPASNEFALPLYADTTKTIRLEVDEANIPQDTTTMAWTIVAGAPSKLKFTSASLVLYDGQKVIITFYVTLASYNVMQSKLTALNKIDDICNCGGPYCSLEPLYVVNSQNVASLVDYKCVYPPPVTGPVPLQQFVYLSSKTAPHRYFDDEGVYQSEITATTKAQEGTEFTYTGNDLLKPNNITSAVGFNEIYGSFSTKLAAAKGAQKVNVTFGKSYDIFVDSGTFSSCASCGNDYFSTLAKIFPLNFTSKGGGYTPDATTTDRIKTNPYRSDEILFGRACFVPATMLPWSHAKSTDRQSQRKARLAAQHFYFANGYQRDWFGFDYGSVIGSFDGVQWFAIGNGRRIKAKSNRLFLAINAYYADQTVDSNFSMVVSDASTAPSSGASSTTDLSNDGAQCQKYHTCDTDTDCVTRLGWEYVCASVGSITSTWPLFDVNATELVNAEDPAISISQMTGGVGGFPKRCVYRGRGAPCVASMTSSSTSFNGTVNSTGGREAMALNSCAPNFYCQTISTNGTVNSNFNDRITRYGKSVSSQNAAAVGGISDADLVGLGSPQLGRPSKYIGTDTLLPGVQANLNHNNVLGICLPGKDPTLATSPTIATLHSTQPAASYYGDRLGGIGVLKSDDQYRSYLTCPVINPVTKNYEHFDNTTFDISAGSTSHEFRTMAASQNLSTSLLSILTGSNFLDNSDLIKDYDSSWVTSLAFEANRCMRAPGAVCHTDFDCAPSKFIADKMSNIDNLDTNLYSILNRYEIEFWQQGLICHQAVDKTDPTYDLKNNRCCREVGKELTIGSLAMPLATTPTDLALYPRFDNTLVPGQGIISSSSQRYSRVSTMYQETQSTSSAFPADVGRNYAPLQFNQDNSCAGACTTAATYVTTTNSFADQINTLHDTGTRTCCTGNWIRHFHVDNGGGHIWDSDKLQKINYSEFQCINWEQCTADSGDDVSNECSEVDSRSYPAFSCIHADQPYDNNCKIRNIPLTYAKKVMNYLRKFDLLGIPQIAIEANPGDYDSVGSEIYCQVLPTDQSKQISDDLTKRFFNNSILRADYYPTQAELDAKTEYKIGVNYYSATDKTNFKDDLKMIFDADKFSCCKPAGQKLNTGEAASNCCTGYSDSTGRCTLRANYTNVSVYYNRLVSSGAKDLSTTLFDSATGAIKDPNIVAQLACLQKVCEGGLLARGVAFSNIKVPGHESSAETYKTQRFIDGNSANKHGGLTDIFDAGMKWNDDIYCVPAAFAQVATNPAVNGNIFTIQCP